MIVSNRVNGKCFDSNNTMSFKVIHKKLSKKYTKYEKKLAVS